MNSPIDRLAKSILQKDTVAECSFQELQQFAEQYPYFGAAQLLFAKKLSTESIANAQYNDLYKKQLRKTSLYFNNSLWLDYLLNDTKQNEVIIEKALVNESMIIEAESEINNIGEKAKGNAEENFIMPAGTQPDSFFQEQIDTIKERPLEKDAVFTQEESEIRNSQKQIKQNEEINDVVEEMVQPDSFLQAKETVPINERSLEQEDIFTQEESEIDSSKKEIKHNIEQINITEAVEQSDSFLHEKGLELTGNHSLNQEEIFIEEIPESHNSEEKNNEDPTQIDIVETVTQPDSSLQENQHDIVNEQLLEQTGIFLEEEPENNNTGEEIKEPVEQINTTEVRGVQTDSFGEEKKESPNNEEIEMNAGSVNDFTQPEPELSIELPTFKIEPIDTANAELVFTPYHTVDYFASQGIKFKEDERPKDKFGQQLKSFTEWLKTLRGKPVAGTTPSPNAIIEQKIELLAGQSLQNREIITEAMAEVWAKQGHAEKAIDIYNKLSLLDPLKRSYFAAKIEELKKTN